MSLMFSPSELDNETVTIRTEVPSIVEHVHVYQEDHPSYETVPQDQWEWSHLRDYVVDEIVKRFGVFPRDAKKEYGIFTSFVSRWGMTRAREIATYAFDHEHGTWRGAPIGITRFGTASDSWFGQVIDQRLPHVATHLS